MKLPKVLNIADIFSDKETSNVNGMKDFVTITFINNQGEIGSSFRLYWTENCNRKMQFFIRKIYGNSSQ